MSFWKSLFGKSNKKAKATDLPPQFRAWVQTAIALMGSQGLDMDNEALRQYLVQHGIPAKEAEEIILFLPTSFCRKMLPEINWPQEYVDYYSEQKQIKQSYKNNKRYVIIQEETATYWKASPDNNAILNIVGRSSEFDAINQMLHDGGKLEDVRVGLSYITRFE